MNLRVIKKDIEYFIGEFIDDCALYIALNPTKNVDGVSAIIDEAVDIYNNLRDAVNHAPEKAGKTYYNGIRKDTLDQLDALCEKLSEAVSST
ncbi:MAG: hypothetical protein MJY62_03255 [Bacteroidales bacterium]|nr:hypothetical protein [Bacteroidales bacterium]